MHRSTESLHEMRYRFFLAQYILINCVYIDERVLARREIILDIQIIELYWNRDERAIAESNSHYGAYCGRIARNILSNYEDAEECVSDTWLRTWECVPPQRPNSLAAFFGRIVRNLSISRYRAYRAQKRFNGITILLSELDDCVPAPSSVEQASEDRLITEAIDNWLSQLPKDDRVLFIRRYWFGDAVNTLAEECGLTQNQMAQRMLRLRKGLKAALIQEGIEV